MTRHPNTARSDCVMSPKKAPVLVRGNEYRGLSQPRKPFGETETGVVGVREPAPVGGGECVSTGSRRLRAAEAPCVRGEGRTGRRGGRLLCVHCGVMGRIGGGRRPHWPWSGVTTDGSSATPGGCSVWFRVRGGGVHPGPRPPALRHRRYRTRSARRSRVPSGTRCQGSRHQVLVRRAPHGAGCFLRAPGRALWAVALVVGLVSG